MKDNRIIIEKTTNTPYFELNESRGYIKLEGRSIPENPADFFDPIMENIHTYFENPQSKTRFDMNLEYINSGSSKYLLSLFRHLQKCYEKGHDLIVNWYYEEDDEDLYSLGEHYQETMRMKINLVEYID